MSITASTLCDCEKFQDSFPSITKDLAHFVLKESFPKRFLVIFKRSMNRACKDQMLLFIVGVVADNTVNTMITGSTFTPLVITLACNMQSSVPVL